MLFFHPSCFLVTRVSMANLKVPSHESYTQRRALLRACLHREEMPPFPPLWDSMPLFPLALGLATLERAGMVALNPRARGNGGISSSEVSRPVACVATLLTLAPAYIDHTSADAPHSLPFLLVFTSRQLND